MATTKKFNRKDLKQDEFIEKVFDLGEWLEANWQRAAIGAGAVVVIVLIAVGWSSWRERSLARANTALAIGLEAYEPARRADGAAGVPRPQEALAKFEEAERLGGSRPIGDVARYYRALALMALDRDADAVPVLERLSSQGGSLASQAKISLAQAIEASGDLERAAGLLQEIASQAGATFPPDAALSMLAALRVRQGKPDEARRIYEDLLARFPQSGSVPEARQRLSELGGSPADGQ